MSTAFLIFSRFFFKKKNLPLRQEEVQKILLEEELFDSERLEPFVPCERRAYSWRLRLQPLEFREVEKRCCPYEVLRLVPVRGFEHRVDDHRGYDRSYDFVLEHVRLVVYVEGDAREGAEQERVEFDEDFMFLYLDEEQKIVVRYRRHEFCAAYLLRG